MKHVALFLALPIALASTAFAQQQTFTVNPDASQVEFALAGSHPVQGTFHVQSGSVAFTVPRRHCPVRLWLLLGAATAVNQAATRR